MNIPIYRAKKIDSDEYVEGNLIEDEGVFYIIKNPVITHFDGLQILTGEYEYLHRIDTTTLSIHFPDMLDNQGNKIFASLSEYGKGGDILYYEDDCQPYICEHSSDGTFLFEYLDDKTIKNYICRLSGNKVLFEDLKAIGIQE